MGRLPERVCGAPLACRGRSGGIRLLLLMPAAAVGVTHGFELLHLVGGEDGGELGVGVLEDGAHLLTALVLGEAGVGVERGHLLVLVGQDGLNLGGLVVGEIEALADVLGGLVGVELVMMAALRGLLLCRSVVVRGLLSGLLGEGRGGGESKCQGRTEKDALHDFACSLRQLCATGCC